MVALLLGSCSKRSCSPPDIRNPSSTNNPSWEGHFWGAGPYETGFQTPDGVPPVTLGQWHMATLAYDGATNVAVYMDGSHVVDFTTGSVLNTQVDPGDDKEDFFIGASNGISPFAGYFDGGVDDVALWSRTLLSGEIEAIYEAGVQGGDLYSLGSVIPEPSTSLIWTLGLLGLAWYGRRRRR